MMGTEVDTKSKLGAGIVGTGFIGPAHVEALRRIGINVVGLVASSEDKCRAKATELGIERPYTSYEAMLADPDIHVVHLTTPNHLHFPQAKAALLAGKHVVCEKPLAMNARESSELVRLAAESGLVNAVHFNLRFYPLVQQARAIVQSKELGELFIVHGSYLQDWLLFDTDWNWRLEPELGGMLRAVGDIGSHWLDLLTFITGLRIESVFADFKTFLPVRKKPSQPIDTYAGKILSAGDHVDQKIQTEDYATILLHFENGVRGVVTISQVCSGRKNRLAYEINGSQSSIAWESEHPNDLWIGHRTQPNQILMKDPSLLGPDARAVSSYPGGHNEGFPDTFKQLANKVYQYILAGDFSARPEFPTFADGHYEQLLGEAIEISAKECRWVDVPEI
jgi:predicted dehydrogenase